MIFLFSWQQNGFGKKHEKQQACEVGRGIATFCMQGIKRTRVKKAKRLQPWLFFLLVRKGSWRQRSISGDLIFLLLFVSRQKVIGLRGYERDNH
jgi:hypothetical protein